MSRLRTGMSRRPIGLSRLRTARTPLLVAAAVAALLVGGCGSSPPAKHRRAGGSATSIPPALLRGLRPVGRGPAFTPPVSGRPTGACAPRLGRREEAHVELFARNRVVLIAAGVGTLPPRRMLDARVQSARCYGDAVTLDPTGTVYFRPGATLQDLFRAWGQPLTATRLASFSGRVRAYVDGRRAPVPGRLAQHEQIVLEVGPYVPPHASYPF